MASWSGLLPSMSGGAVLTVLSSNGLLFNPAKCIFAQPAVDFLGHRVLSGSIVPFRKHMEAVLDFPRPGAEQHATVSGWSLMVMVVAEAIARTGKLC